MIIKIKTPQITATESADGSKATITVEPLEKGLGITLGNALRRMLFAECFFPTSPALLPWA